MSKKKVLELDCGESSLLVECIDIHQNNGLGTIPSGLGDDIKKLSGDVFGNVVEIAQSVSADIRNRFNDAENMPKELELELNFAITTAGKLLILSGESETGIKLKLTWKD